MSSNYAETCQTCLMDSPELTAFNKTIYLDGETQLLYKILEICTSLKIVFKERQMCKECVTKLSNAFSFRKQCWEAHEILKTETTENTMTEENCTIYNGDFFKFEDIIEEDDTFAGSSLDETISQDTLLEVDLPMNIDDDLLIKNSESMVLVDFKDANLELDDDQGSVDDLLNVDSLSNLLPINVYEMENPSLSKRVKKTEWSCRICGRSFLKQSTYKSHVRYHDPKFRDYLEKREIGEFQCDECGKQFTRASSYRVHMKLHDPNNPHKCTVCEKVFSAASFLRTHYYVHASENEKPFQCKICGKKAVKLADLKLHMRFHTKERPYKCPHCDKTFITTSHRTDHVRTHATEAIFECITCHKKFTSTKNLKKHMKIHDKDKYVKCDFCEKRFAFNKELLIHLRTHAQYEPFRCDVCGRNFVAFGTLETHIRIHHANNNADYNDLDK